ncbi:hypothetical protein C3F34_01355 [Acinetobacter sp. ACNIH2]|uniref:hypothetical protein n=1 Tax=Acinetobacter sp. ACNIH2 TaxID=1758189 RepID=UPI000CDCC0E3|nr:hypothetical protein [Acinetobacter sp. ACNIH2]AUX84851.1 hypothetical protein C3F34_01355 [Acinetobacter sp. ACNIH2]
MSKKVDLSWHVDGLVHSFNYYRYEISTPINGLPPPIVTGITETSYSDSTIEENKNYFFRIGAVRGSNEKISSESTFTTVDWLKNWILSNASVGDAWIVKDAILDGSGNVLSIPSKAGKEAAMLVTSSTKPPKTGNHLTSANSVLKLNDTNKTKWRFLHERDKNKYIVLAIKVTGPSTAQVIASTGEPSTAANVACAIYFDYRTTVPFKNTTLFQCSRSLSSGTTYTSKYLSAAPPTLNKNIVFVISQTPSVTNNIPVIKEDLTSISNREFEANTIDFNDPASVLTLLNSPSGSSPFVGNFYGAMVVDKIPNATDQQLIFEYMSGLFE